MFEIIQQLHAEGVTILLVEQNVTRTLDIADRAYLLTTGNLTASGTPEEIKESIDIAAAYLGGVRVTGTEE
jgi:branched-chain amino acid transport system ATP-binding protein